MRVHVGTAGALAGALALGAGAFAAVQSGLWTIDGQNVFNTRNQTGETRIGPSNAASLQVKWAAALPGDISATPAVDGTTVYVPDWKGNLHALDRMSGATRWSRSLASYTGVTNCQLGLGAANLARATPAIAGSRLLLGDQGGRCGAGARVFSVDKQTGTLQWVTQIDSHFAALVTQPVTVDPDNPDVAYVGVASMEEALAGFIPDYACCTFRGSVVALDVKTGRVLWKTYTTPAGYSGAGVWGSLGALDQSRRSLYVTTGNNYSVPADVIACVEAAPDDQARKACQAADNYFDSILSLDIRTGAIRWATFALPYDTWNVACLQIPGIINPGACPQPTGPDYDFAQGPALFSIKQGGKPRDVVGAGQKSGLYWVVDRATGAVIWNTKVGPGGTLGGLQWGSASDGRIYAQVNNNELAFSQVWTLQGSGRQAGMPIFPFNGFFSALDASSGQILWQTKPDEDGVPFLGGGMGAVTVANGVFYACSLGDGTLNMDFSVTYNAGGTMYAVNAATGDVLWRHASGDFCAAGPAVSNGTVFWGTGYSQLGLPDLDGGGKLFAFGL